MHSAGWEGFSVERIFRGCRLNITVHNPQHVSRGVIELEVDGNPVDGNLFVPAGGPGEHQVVVWMG